MTEQPIDKSSQHRKRRLNLLVISSITSGIFLIIVAFIYVLWFSAERQEIRGPAIVTSGEYTGTVYDPPAEIDDFVLPTTTGTEMSLSDFRERYVLMFFGYTNCPDVCPATLAEFRQVKEMLGEKADQVTFIFISVDGPRDTPEILADYIDRFDSEFIGMSGTDEALQSIDEQFGLYYERLVENATDGYYLVNHTSRSFLIGPQGRLRMSFSYGTDADIIADGIRRLMQLDGRT